MDNIEDRIEESAEDSVQDSAEDSAEDSVADSEEEENVAMWACQETRGSIEQYHFIFSIPWAGQ